MTRLYRQQWHTVHATFTVDELQCVYQTPIVSAVDTLNKLTRSIPQLTPDMRGFCGAAWISVTTASLA